MDMLFQIYHDLFLAGYTRFLLTCWWDVQLFPALVQDEINVVGPQQVAQHDTVALLRNKPHLCLQQGHASCCEVAALNQPIPWPIDERADQIFLCFASKHVPGGDSNHQTDAELAGAQHPKFEVHSVVKPCKSMRHAIDKQRVTDNADWSFEEEIAIQNIKDETME